MLQIHYFPCLGKLHFHVVPEVHVRLVLDSRSGVKNVVCVHKRRRLIKPGLDFGRMKRKLKCTISYITVI